jgi:hypothetical protein
MCIEIFPRWFAPFSPLRSNLSIIAGRAYSNLGALQNTLKPLTPMKLLLAFRVMQE